MSAGWVFLPVVVFAAAWLVLSWRDRRRAS